MKRLFAVISLIAAVAMGLVSCKSESVNLHPRVGEVYKDPVLYAQSLPGDGIIFYVDEAGDSALICSMADLKVNRFAATPSQDTKWDLYNTPWNTFGRDTLMERDTNWADIIRRGIRAFQQDSVKVYPVKRKKEPFYVDNNNCVQDSIGKDTITGEIIYKTVCDTIFNVVGPIDAVLRCDVDSNYYFGLIGANSSDGRINTDIIIKASIPRNNPTYDSTKSAAVSCRNFFHKNYFPKKVEDAGDTAYIKTKGQWFLPSLEELRHLFDARNKINDANASTRGFEALRLCYWTSSERDGKNAWYKCFTDNGVESYLSKSNASNMLPVRAVRKVKL